MLRYLEEVAVIYHALDDVFDVVRLVRFDGNETIEFGIRTVDRIVARFAWNTIQVILRKKAHQLANTAQTIFIVSG